ncbi:rod-binding protein [Salinarimonas ramus]|uniref:Flagellar protein FlgJ N-terminal domain-containing protein n=1 Tax=Salinarimonas ramus TaxID=690164 RepID=A0A917Q7J2_9HYPH|nr:rod-binding protein [Salinarimonas ramus]GGK33748.1 hypothetical protein GCM10011322_20520 [Salinarimonas ramus]
MTIQPPSDIILEVARAADPTALAAATERLRDIAAARGRTGDGFETMVAEAARPPAPPPVPMPPPSPERLQQTLAALAPPTQSARIGAGPDLASGSTRSATGAAETPAQAFEATFLRQVVETLMPQEASVFGEGTAGSVWRGFLAEEIGAELARAGGVGIARAVAAAHPELDQVNAAKATLWPEHATASAALPASDAPYFTGFYRT